MIRIENICFKKKEASTFPAKNCNFSTMQIQGKKARSLIIWLNNRAVEVQIHLGMRGERCFISQFLKMHIIVLISCSM